MSSLLKIGLIGCGYLGGWHLKHLMDINDIDVCGVWDTDAEALRNAVDKYGADAADSLETLIASCDAVDVVTPTNSHYDIAAKALDSGKHVFIEKPLCADIKHGRMLVDQAASNGLTLQVGHIERFNRAFRSMSLTEVKPQFIEVHRLAPWNPRGVDVAVVHDLMIHDLDLVLSLADDSVDHVHANGVGVITDSVDIATARIQFTGGLVANITASRISLKQMRKMRIFARNAYVALDMGKGTCEYVRLEQEAKESVSSVQSLGSIEFAGQKHTLSRSFIEAVEGDALRLELEAFRDAVSKRARPIVSGEDGLKALELADRIVQVIKEGA